MPSTVELVKWVTTPDLLPSEKTACIAAGLDPKKIAFYCWLVETGRLTDG